jgi:hypothetical protein
MLCLIKGGKRRYYERAARINYSMYWQELG